MSDAYPTHHVQKKQSYHCEIQNKSSLHAHLVNSGAEIQLRDLSLHYAVGILAQLTADLTQSIAASAC